MAKLFGAQRLVLQAIQQAPADAAGFVTDAQIVQSTRIALKDVRDWIATLEGEDFVEVAQTSAGVIASITPKGRLQLGLYPPIQAEPEGVGAAEPVQASHLSAAPTAGSPPMTSSASGHAPSPSTFIEPAVPLTGAVDGYQVVLLIHGIRTQADWGPMVRSKLEAPGKIDVIPIRYGYFDAFRFWFPFWTRNKPIERVYTQIRVALQKSRKTYPNARLSIIAHSFGTYIIGEILKRGFDLQFHRLILCGSVLPQDFPWEQYQGRFDDDKAINECGKADIWPVLAQSASWGYGASGTHGFGAVLVKDRFHEGGHGQYFDPEFVEKYWEPFIRRGEYRGTEFETKMPATPWRLSVLGAFPLKSCVLVMTVLLAMICASGRSFWPVSSFANHGTDDIEDQMAIFEAHTRKTHDIMANRLEELESAERTVQEQASSGKSITPDPTKPNSSTLKKIIQEYDLLCANCRSALKNGKIVIYNEFLRTINLLLASEEVRKALPNRSLSDIFISKDPLGSQVHGPDAY